MLPWDQPNVTSVPKPKAFMATVEFSDLWKSVSATWPKTPPNIPPKKK